LRAGLVFAGEGGAGEEQHHAGSRRDHAAAEGSGRQGRRDGEEGDAVDGGAGRPRRRAERLLEPEPDGRSSGRGEQGMTVRSLGRNTTHKPEAQAREEEETLACASGLYPYAPRSPALWRLPWTLCGKSFACSRLPVESNGSGRSSPVTSRWGCLRDSSTSA